MRDALTLVPASVAAVIVNVLTGIAAIPIRDAQPAQIMLVGHRDRLSQPVELLLEFARAPGENGDRWTVG